jgi:chromosome segregation ATPase
MALDFSTLDLNALPVWLVAIAIVLYLLPGILRGFAPFIPPLASLLETHKRKIEAREEREDTALHWKLESEGLRLSNEFKAQERLIDILEQSLERMFDDRAASEANYEMVSSELKDLRHQIQKMGSTLSLHSSTIAKLADEQEQLRGRLGQLPERVESLKSYIEAG